MPGQDDKIPATDTHLGPYAELSDEQKKLIWGTRLAFFLAASGHYNTGEAMLEDMVRSHNEVSHIEDIDNLFKTRPDVFPGKVPDVATGQQVTVSRPLQLRR